MKKIIFITGSLCLLLTVSCKKNKSTENNPEATEIEETVIDNEHTSENSLDWEGSYSGVLPCADCEGISTEISISSDNTFILKQQYLGKDDDTVHEYKGTFSWKKDGSTIILNDIVDMPGQYFVGEGKLIQLDMEGKKIEGDLADKYILLKQ